MPSSRAQQRDFSSSVIFRNSESRGCPGPSDRRSLLDLTVPDKRLNLALAVNFSNGRDHDAKLSPLNSLRAFEAAARHLSFTHAAIELNVTHSAISQHVKTLEQHLNCQLFVRVSRGLMLTTEGENLLPVLNDSFDRIAGMLDRFANHRAQEKLKIGVVGTFAIGVLFSQLDDFRRGYPHIDLQLSTHNNRVDPAAEGLDYTIRYGGGAWHGTEAEFLCHAPLAPLCTPDIATSLHCPADILRFTLLRSYRRDEWTAWMQAAGEHSLRQRTV